MGFDATGRYQEIHGLAGTIYVDPGLLSEVKGLGLTDFANTMSLTGGEPAGVNSRRSVVRLDHGNRSWFLKRFGPPKSSEVLGAALRLKSPESHARIEARMAAEFESAGLATYRVAAFGESADPPRLRSSFLLTVGLEPAVDLFEIAIEGVSGPDWPARKRKITLRLAAAVRRMHDAGITHPDLYSYHVFAKGRDAEDGFAFIDLHRAEKKSTVSLRRAASDLAGLSLSFPGQTAGARDRLRFLMAYCSVKKLGPAERKLARTVTARAGKIRERRRFREIREGRKP